VGGIAGGARRLGPAHLVLAVPVAPPDTLAALSSAADEAVCLQNPTGVGVIRYYHYDFHRRRDAEVTDLLGRAALAN